jgi:carbonic anhydrase
MTVPDPSALRTHLIEANALHADGLDPGAVGPRPTRKLAVVTCMDCRLDVYAMLGLERGEAHVIRNAGGIVTDDVIRSLCLSQQTLGTDHVVVIHHTGCGLEGLSNEDFVTAMTEQFGSEPGWSPGGFADVMDDLRASVQNLEASPFVDAGSVWGFVYDVDTGRLEEMARVD